MLRDILVTYAAFHQGKPQKWLYLAFVYYMLEVLFQIKQYLFIYCNPEVSYAQGMNDLCSRFLEVLDSEVDTFWSFSCYMEKFSKDFRADGLHRKIGKVYIMNVLNNQQMHEFSCLVVNQVFGVLRIGGSFVKGTRSTALLPPND